MKNILLALFLVLPFTVSAAKNTTANEIGGQGFTSGGYSIYCSGCPQKSYQEQFVDELTIANVGVVVVWNKNNRPKRIVLISTSSTPVQYVCDTFKKYWPDHVTKIVLPINLTKNYDCG